MDRAPVRCLSAPPEILCHLVSELTSPPLSIALAFEMLSPRAVCAAFARGVGRPVRYVRGPVEIKVGIPNGYREQLDGIGVLFGQHSAPYFGPELEAPKEAIALWEGYRGIEEYAREVFPVEEAANGLTWMNQ